MPFCKWMYPLWLLFLSAGGLFSQHPLLKITYPAHYDTFDVAKLRIAGVTHPEALISINDISARVYPTGAFIGRVDLQPGLNKILVQCKWRQQTLRDTIKAFRPPPLIPLPIIPTAFDSTILEPVADVWLMPGDRLEVRCKASPNAQGELLIPEMALRRPLLPSTPFSAGIYTASLMVGDWLLEKPLQLCFSLIGPDGLQRQKVAPGKLTVLSPERPLCGWTIAEANIWNAAQEGVVITVLPDSVPLQLNGKIGSRWRVRLGKTLVGYIEGSELHAEPQVKPLASTPVSAPIISYEKDWLRLDMKVNHPLPFILEQSIDPPIVELVLYGGYISSTWITYPRSKSVIKNISWSQPEEEVLRWRIELEQKQQWGHRVVFDKDRLSLYVRRTPARAMASSRPLEGLIIAIDPGHGGSESGAISPTGLEEKEINLRYAGYVADYLRKAGAAIVLTRSIDTTLTIQQRIATARLAQAHLYLWLHNNSVGPEVDAIRVRGTSTYFYVPQNRALAEKVYYQLRQIGLAPYGCIQESYTVTRVPDMLAVLVEGAFMSHPEDERWLMQSTFLRRLAAAVGQGVMDFVASSR